MEAHDDQTVSNRTWRLVGLEAPFSSLTFQEVLAFYQTPHSLSKAPLVEGGKCDMRRCTWCRGSMSWYQQQRKEKGEKTVEKTPSELRMREINDSLMRTAILVQEENT